MMKVITSAQLAALAATADDLTIIDVLTPEDYVERHLPEAINACIYEVVFLDRVHGAIPDRNARIVVYDGTESSRAARQAAERLLAHGYGDVSILTGGLAQWVADGYPVIGKIAAVPQPTLEDGRFALDATASRLKWTGRNINNRHYGTISLAAGSVAICCGMVGGGNVTLDMTSITNRDLTDESYTRRTEC